MKHLLCLAALLVLSFGTIRAQSPVFGFPNGSGSNVFWPSQSGSNVFGLPGGGPAPTTLIATVFNESVAGAALTGSKPATDIPGNSWILPSGVSACQYASGGGATCAAASYDNILSIGSTPPSSYTVTFSGLTNNSGMQYVFGQIEGTNSGGSHRMAINLLGATGVRFFDCLQNTGCNVITTLSVASGATGSIVVKVVGTLITVTAFNAAPYQYNTTTASDPALGQYLGLFNFAATNALTGGITVTTP